MKFLRLETLPLTVAFWGSVVLLALAFGLCRYPPMIDYPQHLAMGALLHRYFEGVESVRATYETNLFTYNAGIEIGIALLSYLVSPEVAGRLILALHAVLYSVAMLALCAVAGRPRWYALLGIPLVYNHITGWGFANFVVAVPLALLLIAGWLLLLEGRRSWWLIAGALVLSTAVAYTHVLVMLCVCVAVAVMAVGRLFDKGESLGTKARALLVPAATLVPAVAFSLGAWYWARATSTTVWEHAWAEGQDDPLWHKLWYLPHNATGNFADGSDQVLFGASIVVAGVLWALGAGTAPEPRMRRLGLVFFVLYLVVPNVFIATFHIYPRFLPFAAAFLAAAIPVVDARRASVLSMAAAVIAVVASGNVLAKFLTLEEMDDALAIVDEMPEGRNLLGVTYEPVPRGLAREVWVHLPAMYQARKEGKIAYTFLRAESVPIHYRDGAEPPRPPGGFEWSPKLYDPYAEYAAAYDLVLVRSWEDSDGGIVDPEAFVFPGLGGMVRPLARRGRFFLYDTSRLGRFEGE